MIIDHNQGQGPFMLYAHLASILVSNGQYVTKGQFIAVMGGTTAAQISSVWDQQWVVELSRAAAPALA